MTVFVELANMLALVSKVAEYARMATNCRWMRNGVFLVDF